MKLEELSVQEFFELLFQARLVSLLDAKLHTTFSDLQKYPPLSPSASKIFYLYLSLLHDGNTRIPLDKALLQAKWAKKWDSVRRVIHNAESQPPNMIYESRDFESVIHLGTQALCQSNYSGIIEFHSDNEVITQISKPWVIEKSSDGKPYLYASKYFEAKYNILSLSQQIFHNSGEITQQEKQHCAAFFENYIQSKYKIQLSDKQLEAIVRGQNSHLMITGGPGTGKTTVICFLLWKLLIEHPEMCDWELSLAAPSGKAADRMCESIKESLAFFRPDLRPDILEKLCTLTSTTLHRCMRLDPKTNTFIHNAKNRFLEKTIFIIDEASMIDIQLFSKFLSALPESNYRLYILGDADQLPSVEAGAVLAALLQKQGDYIVTLNESKRFDGKIKHLAELIHEAKTNEYIKNDRFPKFQMLPTHIPWTPGDVQFYSLASEDELKGLEYPKLTEHRLKHLLSSWVHTFYPNLIHTACSVCPTENPLIQQDLLNKLWNISIHARILSAERNGLCGVIALNDFMHKLLGIPNHENYYPGQLIMITRNLPEQKLFNGDSGIIVSDSETGRLYLLLKKINANTLNNENSSDYVFYPLNLLPQNSLESAYAITIHKAQGSGYNNILMFLPEWMGHPLLNNQIVYTGVTRTKRGCLTIISNQRAFRMACKTVIERDTGL